MEYKYKISVVICTYNRETFLTGLMESIVCQKFSERSFEIIFVNNNSTDQTENICQKFIKDFPGYTIRYFTEINQGLSFARNRGIKEAQGEYVTFADDDAILAPDFLEKSCAYLDKYPELSEIGGPIFLRYMGGIPAWENPYINSLFGYFYPSSSPYEMRKKNKKYPRGSNMTFRSDVFSVSGNFNTALGRVKRMLMGGEEKDIAFRILDAGKKIAYFPEIIVYHLVPENRTTRKFICEQAFGIGQSEQIRSKNTENYSGRLLLEGFKWTGTLILWLYYMLTFRPQKANVLIYFRYRVSQGLLSNVK